MYSLGVLIVDLETARRRLLYVFEVPDGTRTSGLRTRPIPDGPHSIGLFTRFNTPIGPAPRRYRGLSSSLQATVTGIEHMESQSRNGVGVIKIYFQPNAKIEEALAEVTSIQQTVLLMKE